MFALTLAGLFARCVSLTYNSTLSYDGMSSNEHRNNSLAFCKPNLSGHGLLLSYYCRAQALSLIFLVMRAATWEGEMIAKSYVWPTSHHMKQKCEKILEPIVSLSVCITCLSCSITSATKLNPWTWPWRLNLSQIAQRKHWDFAFAESTERCWFVPRLFSASTCHSWWSK